MTAQIMKLIAKDFSIQLKSLIGYLLVGLLMFVLLSVMPVTDKQILFSMITFVIVYSFTNKALYEDEKNNTLRLLVSLPVKRRVIVYARYISVLMIIVATVGILLLLTGFLAPGPSAGGKAEYDTVTFISLSTISVFIIMLSFYLPLSYKLGYIKAANANRFIFIGFFAFLGAGSVFLSGLAKGGAPSSLKGLDKFISSVSLDALMLIIALFVLAVYFASMQLAVRFFEKRNLF